MFPFSSGISTTFRGDTSPRCPPAPPGNIQLNISTAARHAPCVDTTALIADVKEMTSKGALRDGIVVKSSRANLKVNENDILGRKWHGSNRTYPR